MTSYQKQKERIKQLEKDIYTLVRSPDTMDGMMLKMRYEMGYRMSDTVWSGSSIVGDTPTQFSGLRSHSRFSEPY